MECSQLVIPPYIYFRFFTSLHSVLNNRNFESRSPMSFQANTRNPVISNVSERPHTITLALREILPPYVRQNDKYLVRNSLLRRVPLGMVTLQKRIRETSSSDSQSYLKTTDIPILIGVPLLIDFFHSTYTTVGIQNLFDINTSLGSIDLLTEQIIIIDL